MCCNVILAQEPLAWQRWIVVSCADAGGSEGEGAPPGLVLRCYLVLSIAYVLLCGFSSCLFLSFFFMLQ